MKKPWIKIKKELELNELGEYIEKRKTFERRPIYIFGFEKKDFIGLVLKFIGLMAIAVPIILFYLNDQAEKRKEKELLEAEVFFKNSSNLYQLINANLTKESYKNKWNGVFYIDITKLKLFGNKRSVEILNDLEFNLKYKPTIDSLTSSYEKIRDKDYYKELKRKLIAIKSGAFEIDKVYIDSLRLNSLFSKQFAIQKKLLEFEEEINLMGIERKYNSNSKLESIKSFNYLNTYAENLLKLDSLQNIFFWELTSIGKIRGSRRLETYAKKIHEIDHQQFKLLQNLIDLEIEYKKYMNLQLDSLNKEFIESNNILREINK